MKKRILCAILTLILLVSLVPATALTASAANRKVSEGAITVLKQLQGYSSMCSNKGYTGYGTPCTFTNETAYGPHGSDARHAINETTADKALRVELAELDTAVNGFATANGLSLSQNQHDALVLFTFRNGTAWLSGTGDVKRAVTTRATGNDFLNMFCNWQYSPADNNRRLIEANMYLNGAYVTSVPSKYIHITYNPDGGNLPGTQAGASDTFYYDVTLPGSELPTPTRSGYTFIGWYDANSGTWVHKMSTSCNGKTLTAKWQKNFAKDENEFQNNATYIAKYCQTVNYTISSGVLASTTAYRLPTGEGILGTISGNLSIDLEYVDKNGIKWLHVHKAAGFSYIADGGEVKSYKNYSMNGWVKAGAIQNSGGNESNIDVTVTVTNNYVNARSKPSIYAGKIGTYNHGDKLRITAIKDGTMFLWGQVARSATDNTPVAWVALMYTNFESALSEQENASGNNEGKVIAKAHIVSPVNGYVNVRNGAGTDFTIVGSVTYDSLVDLYEIKYVNGQQWGRCSRGWFCLAYANVTRLVAEGNETNDLGFTSYAFTGTIYNADYIFTAPSESSSTVVMSNVKAANRIKSGDAVTVTNITVDDSGNTWGKISLGWIMLSKKNGNDYVLNNFSMNPAKYEVTASSATVRNAPNTNGTRVDTLTTGVEFDVTIIVADTTTVWGYADKVGDTNGNTYSGWVNLSSKYVKRNNAPVIVKPVEDPNGYSGETATIIGADMVNVRKDPSIYGAYICQVAYGTTCKVIGKPDDGWYRLEIPGREGQETWVYGQYLDITAPSGETVIDPSTGEAKIDTGKGIIANTYAGVNVRQAAGIGGAFLGKILPGTVVEIKETKMIGNTKWGRVDQGWICMDYVTMITFEEYPDANGNTGSTGGNTVTDAQPAIYTGTANTALTIYKTTDLNSDIVRELNAGDAVTIHEILTVDEETKIDTPNSTNDGSSVTITKTTTYWARVNDGYIRNPGDNLTLDSLDEGVYTLTDAGTLIAYVNSDLTGTSPFALAKGEQVTVTQVVIVKNKVHGFVEYKNNLTGWIDLTNMTKGAITVQTENTPAPSEPETSEPVIGSTGNTGGSAYVPSTGEVALYTGRVVNNPEVNVRSTPDSTSTTNKLGTVKRGDVLNVYETRIADNMAWGRTEKGWIYLWYLRITPASGSAIDANVINKDGVVAYPNSDCSGTPTGTYVKMSVVNIYEKVGDMVRTDLGWISKDALMHAN